MKFWGSKRCLIVLKAENPSLRFRVVHIKGVGDGFLKFCVFSWGGKGWWGKSGG